MVHLPFADRLEAGRLLASELARRNVPADAVVVALTRGGVPVGSSVADRLHLQLDVLAARKIGVPWQPEIAMGAVAGQERILQAPFIRRLGLYDDDVEELVAKEQSELRQRDRLYRGKHEPIEIAGRSVVLVDDGLATGSTMLAAVHAVRKSKPEKLIVAVPVASPDAADRLRTEVDELVCLAVPELFFAVGEWYRDFPQVEDHEVQAQLAESRRRHEQKRVTPAVA